LRVLKVAGLDVDFDVVVDGDGDVNGDVPH
jgi:hypothetical protein